MAIIKQLNLFGDNNNKENKYYSNMFDTLVDIKESLESVISDVESLLDDGNFIDITNLYDNILETSHGYNGNPTTYLFAEDLLNQQVMELFIELLHQSKSPLKVIEKLKQALEVSPLD